MGEAIKVGYYSDVLCVWAYVAQVRLDELKGKWPQVRFEHFFIDVFGCTEQRIGEGWKSKGGYEGFGDHVLEVCEGFPHVAVNARIWRDCRPRSSANAHLVLKALQVLQDKGLLSAESEAGFNGRSTLEEFGWQVRLAFFRDARDIGDIDVLLELARSMSLAEDEIRKLIGNGEAIAALMRDENLKQQHRLEGSPTVLMNEGRQKLYGNVGYRILEANVQELLERPASQASWC